MRTRQQCHLQDPGRGGGQWVPQCRESVKCLSGILGNVGESWFHLGGPLLVHLSLRPEESAAVLSCVCTWLCMTNMGE